eukprot:TRINITY_DN1289_c0_g4_i3.p1 TRINITY_DN1289_c0_g4~~TRINITY_DN1289_c0_g4_i3.p1  ORF type:complete len:473 (-),score=119.43 TRINITY_DN1289_c0_g4_i3:315-1550(-)
MLVAIKQIDLEGNNVFDDSRKEISFLRASNHPNIVPFYCSFVHGRFLWLIMEQMNGGSVLDIMRYAYPRGLDDEHIICTILRDTLKAVEYLHNTGRMHRDIKAGNILIGSDGEVKLADFGLSAWFVENGQRKDTRQTFVGTPCWMAPEVMEGVGYDQRADIWSFGITALELTKGQAPFASFPPMKVLMMTLDNPPPQLDREKTEKGARYSKAFKDMIDTCLQKAAGKRPTATKLLDHKFWKRAKKQEYILNHMLKKLPPLAERAKKLKKPPPGKQEQKKVEPGDETWDFEDKATIQPGNNSSSDTVSLTSTENLSSPNLLGSPSQSPILSHTTVTTPPINASPSAETIPPVTTNTTPSTTSPTAGAQSETTQRGRFTVTETKSTGTTTPATPTTVPVTEKKGRFTVHTTVH